MNYFVAFRINQSYVKSHPEVVVVDPIENILMLLDRRKQYEYVRECDIVDASEFFFVTKLHLSICQWMWHLIT